MFQRLVFTIMTAVSLTGLYVLYSVATRPLIVIPEMPKQAIEEVDSKETELPAENVRVAQSHVPLEKWAADSQHTLRIEQAFVYTDNWKLDDDNKKNIYFQPFAMVWLTPNQQTGKEESVSVVSDSAQLEFETPFDEKSRSVGRVVRGFLKGRVEIKGPNNLSVSGREFIFDESSLSISTWHPVNFRFQSHFGSANRMQMKLIAGVGAPSKDRPHVSGIESVQLFAQPNKKELVKLQVSFPQGDEFVPVNVRCSGELKYTFATNTAVLTKDVIAGTVKDKTFDTLQCEVMTMKFVPKPKVQTEDLASTNTNATGGSPKNEFQKIESDLELSWFQAEGHQDDRRPVWINSQTRGIRASMTSLIYQAETRQISMKSEGFLRDVEVTLKPSEQRRNWSILKAPKIDAQLGKDSLESLFCVGAGELLFGEDSTKKPKFQARWQRQLSLKPDPITNLDLVELEEKADFLQPDQKRGLAAESIKIWLTSMARTFDVSSSGTAATNQSKAPDPEPKRILASGDIALQSPEMVIERSNELIIHFDEPNPATQVISSRKMRDQLQATELKVARRSQSNPLKFSAVDSTSRKNLKSKTPQVGFANVPVEHDGSLGPSIEIPFESEPSPESLTKRKVPSQPFVVSADRIFARMSKVVGSQEPKPQEVRAEGSVEIKQSRGRGEKPLRMRGNRVLIEAQTDKDYAIQVLGTPALIQEKRMQLEGNDIHLEQNVNRAWIVGKGTLTLPIPENSRPKGMDAAPSGDLIVHWNESMDFNGEDAKFLGQVKARVGHAKMHCEQMLVQLSHRIAFQSEGNEAFSENPELKTILCRENVKFEHSSYFGAKLIDVYRGKVGEFVIEFRGEKGDVRAQGPGEIRVWQRKKKAGDEVATRDTIQANRPIATEVAEWNYTYLQFEGQLVGSFNGLQSGHPTRQSVTIDDRVEVIHGPVDDPLLVVDPDNLPSKGGTIRCNRLQIVNRPSSDKADVSDLELVGKGNAEVEGQVDKRQFTASADEISYDGSKSLYRLRAYGKQNARITGIDIGNQTGRTIEFNPDPKHRILRVDGATTGQFSP